MNLYKEEIEYVKNEKLADYWVKSNLVILDCFFYTRTMLYRNSDWGC